MYTYGAHPSSVEISARLLTRTHQYNGLLPICCLLTLTLSHHHNRHAGDGRTFIAAQWENY